MTSRAQRRAFGRDMRRIRRKLQKMPEEMRRPITNTIVAEAEAVADEIRSNIPYDADSLLISYGKRARKHLRDALQVRITRKGMFARVGYVTPKVKETYWFARLLEYGFYPGGGTTFVQKPFFFDVWRRRANQTKRNIVAAAKRGFRRAVQ